MSTRQAISRKRTRDIGFALFLFIFGSYGLWVDHLHQLGEDAAGLHLHNMPAPMLCAAMICSSFVMVAALFDDYRGDWVDSICSPSAEVGKWAGCALIAAAIAGSSPG
jgi:hypothetical protein